MQTATVLDHDLHYELRPVHWSRAVSAGLIIGAVFTRMLDLGIPQHELNPFITHLAFGAVVAGFYKGRTRRRVPVEDQA